MSVAMRARQHLPVVSLAGACLLVGLLQFVVPMSTTVRALFIPAGITISLLVYYITTDIPSAGVTRNRLRNTGESQFAIDEPNLAAAKGLTALALLTVAVTALLGTRLVPLVVFLMVGYGLVVVQMKWDPDPELFLFELCLLFAVPVVAVYLTTGVFFGGSDTFAHIQAIQGLLAADSIAGIGSAGVAYVNYPGFHIVVGTLAAVTNMPPYDAIVLTGLVLVTTLVVFTYTAVTRLFDDYQAGLGSAMAVTLLSILTYYTIYFYPQSMAVVFLSCGVYLYARFRTTDDTPSLQRFVGLTVVLAALMAVTHHLTFVLFALAVVVVLCVAGLRWVVDRSRLSDVSLPPLQYLTVFPLLFSYTVLTAYWIHSSSQFIERVFRRLSTVSDSGGVGEVAFGAGSIDQIGAAFDWLLGFNGVYAAVLLALAALAFYELTDYSESYADQLTILVAGLLFVGILLPLPASVTGLQRFRLVVVLIAVVPLGIALSRLSRAQGASLAGVVLLVALIGVSSAFVSPLGNDIDALAGDEKRIQVAFEDDEYAELGSSGQFVGTHTDETVTTRWLSWRAVRAQGYDHENYDNLELRRDGLAASNGIVLVREDWTEHKVTTNDGPFTVTQERYDSTVASRNKVYTTGGVDGFWQREDYTGVFGP